MEEIAKDANTTLYVKIAEDENVNIDLKTQSGLTIKQEKIDMNSEGKYQAGVMLEIGLPLEGNRNAIIMINKKEANSTRSSAHGGGTTEACESCVFIHEALDHGLHFVRTGIGEPPNLSIYSSVAKKQAVEYQNKALRIKRGSHAKLRDGSDHGDKK